MIPAAFAYHRAEDLDDAIRVLAEHGDEAKVLAGGMSLIPLMKMRLAQPAVIVDVGGLTSLRYVRKDGDRLRIGALTRHVELARDPLVRLHAPILARMAGGVGDAQVRARGTIGGVLAHADGAGDYCTLAQMLDVEIVTSVRSYRASDFLVDFMTTPLAEDEVVTEVVVPIVPGRQDYLKFRRRRTDWALVGVAVQEWGEGWRIGLTNVAATALRGVAAEVALAAGASAQEASAALADDVHPLGDVTVPVDYKRWLVQTLTERALTGLGVP